MVGNNTFELNKEQKKAVETVNGPVLIVAGAGSGKTKVITHRILNIIKRGVSPKNILAITFTNKAAKEMKDRVNHLITSDKEVNLPITSIERPFVSTFHALGVYIIRQHADYFGLTKYFSIYDRSDSKRAIKEAMNQLSIDPKKFDPGFILNKISRAKGDGYSHTEYADLGKDFIDEMVGDIWQKYEALLNKEKALDFDDLLSKTAKILRERKDIREHYGKIWRYIHIDEYQDTNKVQYDIARLLAESHRNICVVGDADQNIYSWRGATIENILNFEKDYPETTVIILEKNYRSTKTILAAANAVIEKNHLRKKKTLYTDNVDGDKIELVVSYSESDEARFVADTCRDIISQGVSPKQIAVLYRANFQSRILEESFLKKNIPYELIGTKFFERKEVKDVVSYVKVALNRDSWSDIVRIVNVPARGIGKATVTKLLAGMAADLNQGTKEKVANFWSIIDRIKAKIGRDKPSEVIKSVIKDTGIENSLQKGDADDEERLLNLRELVTVATQYDDFEPEEGMMKFLEHAALATDQDEVKDDKDAVRLMTVHAAKGLEFDHVFIVGLEQGLFPFKHLDENDISLQEEEEERRLFYVALTRAKQKLYLSYAIVRNIYGADKVCAPSEFIDDIDKEFIQEQVPDKPTGAKAIFIDF